MAEPSRRASRLTIAGAMLAAIGVGAAGFALGRSMDAPTGATAPPPVPGPAPAPVRVLPAEPPPLDRAALIAAAGDAADAFAAGRPLPESVRGLAGRDFELRLPFGCPGAPELGGGALGFDYDADAETLRVRADPVRWPSGEWLPAPDDRAAAADAVEGVEGFWIARPWTSSDACPPAGPAPAGAPAPPVAAERTLGIAQFFTVDESRIARRDGKAYEAVARVAPAALDVSRGLHLRLRGKLTPAPGAGPVLCRAQATARPACVLSVTFDAVGIENVATGATVATWDVASQTREPAER